LAPYISSMDTLSGPVQVPFQDWPSPLYFGKIVTNL
jgi:hypothetical protein